RDSRGVHGDYLRTAAGGSHLQAKEKRNQLWNGLKCFRALCCKGPPPARPEYDLVCIGLTGSGKTSLLSKLCSESPENVVSTTGFSIKAVPFQNAILNVKELGGADNIRKYWSRYYQGSQGVIFVLDSASSEDDLETARNELHSALQHPQLCTLPFLILANHQDKPAARSVQENKAHTTHASLKWWEQCSHNNLCEWHLGITRHKVG
uniref:ARF like GTPase 15 n=1 Tax=Felis catus TaxID=9685 RepID=A0ABI7XQM5_FELCA